MLFFYMSRIFLICGFIMFFRLIIKIPNPSVLSETIHLIESNKFSNMQMFSEMENGQNLSEIEDEFNFDYEKMMKNLKLDLSKFYGHPLVSSNKTKNSGASKDTVFRGLSNWIFDKRSNTFEADKIKCGDIVFVKTDHIKEFFEQYHSNISKKYFLMTHDSAFSVGYPWQIKYLNDPKIITWFAKNTVIRHPKLLSIPLGVVAPDGDTMTTIYTAMKNPIPYNNRASLIYSNFATNTNENRSAVVQYFRDNFSNTTVVVEDKRTDWKSYLLKLGDSQFVVSPPGAGPDCHRTWEALAMGAVPIVLNSELLPLYENMPVMIVNDWNEVTNENLIKFQNEKMKPFSKDGFPWRPKLWLRYWINYIVSVKLDYYQTYCKE